MLQSLKEQQTQLIVQRSQAKDVVELAERRLETITAIIGALEADAKSRADAEKAPDSE